MEAKQKNLQTMQKAAPDLEGKSEKIRQQIVTINQQRAQLAVDYKDSVRVRVAYCIYSCMYTLMIGQIELTLHGIQEHVFMNLLDCKQARVFPNICQG